MLLWRHLAVRYLAVLCACAALSYGLAETGVLGVGDPQLPSGEYMDLYERHLEAGTTISITVESTQIDPYLVILGPDGADLLQVDDSDGFGLNVRTSFTAPQAGLYSIVVTSALPEEVGDYLVEITVDASDRPVNPLTPVASDEFSGRFTGDGLELELIEDAGQYEGTLTFQGQVFPVTAVSIAQGVEGSFTSGGSLFPFTARLVDGVLELESDGALYRLLRDEVPGIPREPEANAQSPNPLTTPSVTTPPAATTAPRLTPPMRSATPAARAIANPGPGFATGFVRRRDGRPLEGVEVRVEGVNMQGGRISAYPVTDADGRYLTRVPDGLVRVNAYLTVDYQDQRYFIRLAPDQGTFDQEFDSSLVGIVRNFSLRFDGLRPGGDPQEQTGYFGGYGVIEIGLPYCCVEQHTVETRSGVRLELTPEGPLLDGTEGSRIVLGCDACVPEPVSYAPTFNRPVLEFKEIPPGRYRVRATLIAPDGTVSPARVGSHHYRNGASNGAVTQELAEELVVVFPPYNLINGEPGVGAVSFYVNE